VIRKCLQQESIPADGDGINIRDWLYVTDHCSGIDFVVRRGKLGEVYNIGGINEWSNIDICRLICQLMDEYRTDGRWKTRNISHSASHSDLISFVADRAGHDWRYAIDASKMNDELDWQPKETLDTGIRKIVRWFLNK